MWFLLASFLLTMFVFKQAARQLEFLRGRSSSGPTTDMLADALAIAQHHDAVSGTQRQHVAADYALRLSMGYLQVFFLLAGNSCVFWATLFSCMFRCLRILFMILTRPRSWLPLPFRFYQHQNQVLIRRIPTQNFSR